MLVSCHQHRACDTTRNLDLSLVRGTSMAEVGNQDRQSQSVLDGIGGTIPAISMAIAECRLGKIASLLVLAFG